LSRECYSSRNPPFAARRPRLRRPRLKPLPHQNATKTSGLGIAPHGRQRRRKVEKVAGVGIPRRSEIVRRSVRSRLRVQRLVHGERRGFHRGRADDARRYPRHGHMRRDVFQHYTARADFCALTHFDVADDLAACSEEHALADLRVAVSGLFPRAPEGHRVQDGDVVFHHRGLPDHDARGMVQHDPAADACSRMDVNAEIGALSQFRVNSGIDEAKALIGQTARLDFKERTCQTPACVQFIDADLGLTGDDLSRAEAATDRLGFGWVINLEFNNRGSEIFSDLTRRISTTEQQLTKRIAIIMDEQLLLAPVARAWIRDGRTQISGNFSREEAQTRAIQLESGRLPVPLKLIQESDVDALLGSESLRNSLIAGLVGLGLVLVFMILYYRMAGVVAAFALVFYAIIVLAIFKMIPVTLELAHIGGFILSIGMAVDANILIFERMKEEVRIGRTLASSMEVGFNRAWPAIRDSNISTMITCLVLLWFGDRLGGGLVTGVAISLFIGVAVSMFTALVVSRNLLQLMAWIGLGGRINLFTPEPLQRSSQAAQTPGGSR